jgi:hypothetical protein
MTAGPDLEAADPSDEIEALVRQLHETQQRLHELTGGEVDAVIHPGGQPYLLRELRKSCARAKLLSDALPAAVGHPEHAARARGLHR